MEGGGGLEALNGRIEERDKRPSGNSIKKMLKERRSRKREGYERGAARGCAIFDVGACVDYGSKFTWAARSVMGKIIG